MGTYTTILNKTLKNPFSKRVGKSKKMDNITFLSLKQLRISLVNFNIASQVDLPFLNPY